MKVLQCRHSLPAILGYTESVRSSEWSMPRPATVRGPLPGIVGAATRVTCRMPAAGSAILYETASPEDIAALAAALSSDTEPRSYCMCNGTLVFELESVGPSSLTLHHGVSIRWDGSRGDVSLHTPDAVMDWLSARGMPFVREEFDATRRRAHEASMQAWRWRAALPSSLSPFFDDMRVTRADSDPAWTAAFEAQFPDVVERARLLLDLFGSSAGPWTGAPAWEGVPERFLLGMPLDVLIAAIGDAPGVRRCEGAARLFSGAAFGRERPQDRTRLSEDLRRMLLEHVEASNDRDKRARARAALGGDPAEPVPGARGSTPGLANQ